jgi:hypothetical protein
MNRRLAAYSIDADFGPAYQGKVLRGFSPDSNAAWGLIESFSSGLKSKLACQLPSKGDNRHTYYS